MNAIDRVMRAYSKTDELTDAQYRQVRVELSAFIQELTFSKRSPEMIRRKLQKIRVFRGRNPYLYWSSRYNI